MNKQQNNYIFADYSNYHMVGALDWHSQLLIEERKYLKRMDSWVEDNSLVDELLSGGLYENQ